MVCGNGVASMKSRETAIAPTTEVAFHPPDVVVTPLLNERLSLAGESNCLPDSDVLLALDGGGVKGYAQALVLVDLEERLGGPGRLLQHLNVLGGTSIGGIIALALSSGKTAADCAEFLRTNAARVFNSPLLVAAFSRQLGLNFWSDELDELLRVFLGSGEIAQQPQTFVMTRTGETLEVVSSGSMLDAARATSALPFVFAPRFLEGRPVWDGGLGANNPVEFAMAKAQRPIALILSLGTGMPVEPASNDSQVILAAALDSQPPHERMKKMWQTSYYRLDVPGIGDITPYDGSPSNLDKLKQATTAYLGMQDTKKQLNAIAASLAFRKFPEVKREACHWTFLTLLETPERFLQHMLDNFALQLDAEDVHLLLFAFFFKASREEVDRAWRQVREGTIGINVMRSMGANAAFRVIFQNEGKDVEQITFTGAGTTGPRFGAMSKADLKEKFGAGHPLVDALLDFRRKAADSRYS